MQHANMIIYITPFGRFCFQRLPFGITSALEFFQKKMSSVHIVLKGMVCLIDDVLVCCSTYKVHDKRFEAALIQNQLQSARVILSTKRKSNSGRLVYRFWVRWLMIKVSELSLCLICQHNSKHNKQTYYASIMD